MTSNAGLSTSGARRSSSGLLEDLVLVSNREPDRHHYGAEGDGETLTVDTLGGGLASATDSLERALAMGDGDRQDRMRALRRRVHEADLSEWLDGILATASEVDAERGCA